MLRLASLSLLQKECERKLDTHIWPVSTLPCESCVKGHLPRVPLNMSRPKKNACPLYVGECPGYLETQFSHLNWLFPRNRKPLTMGRLRTSIDGRVTASFRSCTMEIHLLRNNGAGREWVSMVGRSWVKSCEVRESHTDHGIHDYLLGLVGNWRFSVVLRNGRCPIGVRFNLWWKNGLKIFQILRLYSYRKQCTDFCKFERSRQSAQTVLNSDMNERILTILIQ